MQPMTTIRNWQIDQMRKAENTIKHIVQTTAPEEAKTIRDGGDGWTILEVMGHLRDFEAVFLERAHLILEQEMPDLPFPDPGALVVDKRYNDDDLQNSFQAWATTRAEHIALLEGVEEGAWERPANHPIRGHFTLNDHLFLTVWHDMNHIEQMAHILVEASDSE